MLSSSGWDVFHILRCSTCIGPPDRVVGNVLTTTDGPYRRRILPITLLAMTALMLEKAFSDELIHRLAETYEEDPSEFVHLPQRTVASSEVRQTVSELRNEGYVEEEIRGVIRLTPRGYKEYKRKASASFAVKAWV
jgi:hypothetical protein